ncbi:hypothetical protein ES703_38158 [subsurface metagenome]
MIILIRVLGVVIVGMGVAFLLRPKLYRQYVAFWQPGKRLYLGAILSLLIGVILLLAATQCRLIGFVLALGILCLVKGVMLFTLGREKMKSMLKWYQGRSLLVLRLVALIAIAFGALLIYSA